MPNVNSAPPVAGLAEFNALSAAEAEAELLTCCASRTFAREVTALRPYRDLDLLAGVAEAAVRDLEWSGVLEALAAHPRIGESRTGGQASGSSPGAVRASPADPGESSGGEGPATSREPGRSGRESGWSRQEQSGVGAAGREVLEELAEGNRAYEERFGHVYLVCATGLSAEEMLARLRERLGNNEEAERDVVRAELAKITRLRLAKLLGGAA
ncbi:2-oxo-4-hydroxy-4-carboxy-5-ureidoimidazoline decarboxylase [Streptosporangium sp. 'caverna']|uniref:2-oxo-4-hydroxy-4-carboxy-5-ureidoimidazoline decarboxylase n=1 Tax=Streptosporangium sp. 'caverna' TaxID=2202249 RepID=UPI000D7D48AD|nr:2-oxo-4-hydroxy-4-carboxy-5-ureidoimidazoline decarboxylase [Streptosporangium sp. 'caverna']AWS41994.1 2-oxo-4-hydroxy-4-carboxy-5-ureidoimidazoline decarboxylase [Streptosporangium sp. 'caverna']